MSLTRPDSEITILRSIVQLLFRLEMLAGEAVEYLLVHFHFGSSFNLATPRCHIRVLYFIKYKRYLIVIVNYISGKPLL